MLRSITPFLLVTLGFTLIALAIKMPLFEWQISEIITDLPSEVHINPFWTTKFGDSLENNSYVLRQVVFSNNGNSCNPEQLTSMVRRSRSDERLERIALYVSRGVVLPLSGLTQPGQITMAILLFICGVYIWWFTSWYNRPIAEAFITTTIAAILLGVLINVWRILVPEIGNIVCRGLHGTLTVNAGLSKIHYETLLILFTGICAEIGALGIIFRLIIKAANRGKASSKPVVG